MLRVKLTIKFLVILLLMGYGQCAVSKKHKNVSLEDATTQIQRLSQGKVLSAKTTKNNNGTSSHKIKVLTPSGRVKVYKVPGGNKPTNKDRNNRRQNNRSAQSNRKTSFKSRPVTPSNSNQSNGDSRLK